MEVESAAVPAATADEQKQFKIPVDSDHKATAFWLFSAERPHMQAFHLSWFCFFTCFVSSFAIPPLLPVIRDNLNLTATDIGNAGITAVSGAVFVRVLMGAACDLVGPRMAAASLALLTTPVVYCTALVNSPTGFLLARFFTGFSLATFVSTQYWMSSMFSPPKVGIANGVSAGWGNLGGGLVQLLMPYVYQAIQTIGSTNFTAWRIAFFVPGVMQTCSGLFVIIFGQDMPDGSFQHLHKSGELQKEKFNTVLYHAVTNYRAWILALAYGYCFGVELTTDNIIAQYFFDRFGLNLQTAGVVAASFGLANIFSRPSGGILSDWLSDRFGMRGRLWGLWLVQTLAGVCCTILGATGTLAGSIAVMVLFSYFCQAACGLTFGVVPFVSRRSLGQVSGMVGAGGNVGAVVTQLIFFRGGYSTQDGIMYMGIMIICCTLPVVLIHFPMWGNMLYGPKGTLTAEEYYGMEWSAHEKEKGFNASSARFAENSVREGGRSKHGGAAEKTVPTNA